MNSNAMKRISICLLVFDDENECKITAGAVITLTVHIQRENMSSLFSKHIDEEEQIDEKENQEKVRRNTLHNHYYEFVLDGWSCQKSNDYCLKIME